MDVTKPLIIEAAINGGTGKSRNPNVPITPNEIDDEARRCIDAGAAIIHSHIDDIRLGGEAAAARYLEGWQNVRHDRPDALIYPTLSMAEGGGVSLSHVPFLAKAGIRMAAFDPGSTNFAEPGADDLPGGRQFVYANSYGAIADAFALMSEAGVAPSLAIYEPGFLRATLAFHRAGKLPRGSFTKLYFGGEYNMLTAQRSNLTFGLPPTEKALDAYLEMLDGSGLEWAVTVMGGDISATPLVRLAIERGGHVRVGLEDFAGERQPGNVELVEAVAMVAREMGRPLATCTQAAEILGVP